ncbi:hypothetical protein FHS85_005240 [Rhodoligotrophos appendicifer]|uniref:Chromosome partitioning protein ParB n=1 Tax=Aurantimonas aggregata TaxID=2047720 RepID=A0A6L9MNB3_9HYPH|nr:MULTISPECIES: hypothetical protein [Hyphomicrobiales]NDV89313.1 hypothetical protein [Aurantimonas aggregata]
MTKPPRKRGFAARPADPEHWIKSSGAAAAAPPSSPAKDGAFTARLTVDVTPDLRGRIKIAAFQRGTTVADMLRELLSRKFPPPSGDPS